MSNINYKNKYKKHNNLNKTIMKKLSLIAIFLFTVFASIMAQDQNVQNDQELIKKVIQEAYVDGLCNNATKLPLQKDSIRVSI
jgi:hypothetical protein